MNRIDKLRLELENRHTEAALITKPENIFYLSGFTGTAGTILITKDKKYFFTDFRYVQQAKKQCLGYEIVIYNDDRKLNDIINEFGLSTLGIEDEYMNVSEFNSARKSLKNTELHPLGSILGKIREIKSNEEIEKIRVAAKLGDLAFDHIIKFIKVGKTERDVALELEFFMKSKGASALSFDSIVASGVRSSLPHGVATDKVIEEGDFVTLDYGCIVDGYCSDMTRTIVMGKASEKQLEIYNTVLKAQVAALEVIKPGVTGKEVDKVARDIITEAGYGEYFGHGLGHGLGLEVHENPRVSPKGESILEVNHVITDEPGIYIPDFGGVRIEDLLYVTEQGYERLCTSTKELIEIM